VDDLRVWRWIGPLAGTPLCYTPPSL